LADEIGGSLEVNAEVIIWMVFAWNVQGEGYIIFGMLDMNVFAGGQK
jgi:hypothetical protein